MDFLSLLSSVNKISLIAFFCVFGALVYEIMLLKRSHTRKGKPTIPKFNTNVQAQATAGKVVIDHSKKKSSLKTSRMGIFFIITIVVLCMVGVFAIGRLLQGSNEGTPTQSTNTKASDISPTEEAEVSVITSTPTLTPTVTPEVVLSPNPTTTITPTLLPDHDDELLALNTSPTTTPGISQTITPTPSPTVGVTSAVTSGLTSATPTPVQQLPLTGNTTFTVMAIGMAGIIVLLSFVF